MPGVLGRRHLSPGHLSRHMGHTTSTDTTSTSDASFSTRAALTLQVSVDLVDYSELQFGKFLGRGAEGEVYAAWYLETPVAVKQTSCMNEVEMHLRVGE